MLKEAINRILELATPNMLEINGDTYTDKSLNRVPKELVARPLDVHTLSAVVDYISSGADGDAQDINRKFVIHVEGHNSVSLNMELNSDKVRECVLRAACDVQTFPFGRFMDVESFIINLQSSFVNTGNAQALCKLVGTVTDGKSVSLADDGITQRATVKTGVTLVGQANIPNRISLAPFRTFSEIEQPESEFVFRVRGGDNGVTAALFAADGDAWKHEAILRIRDYFQINVPGQMRDKVIILA